MRRIILILMLLGVSSLARAQQKVVLTAASASCTTASCLSTSVDPTQGGATFTVTANASGNTIQIEASGDGGTTWVALNATPSNGTTAVTSITSTGSWQANVAAYTNIRLRMSTLVSGSTTVSIIESTASARAGGGTGGGSINIATNQVAFGTGANAIGGSNNFTYTGTQFLVKDTVTALTPIVTATFSGHTNNAFGAGTDDGPIEIITDGAGNVGIVNPTTLALTNSNSTGNTGTSRAIWTGFTQNPNGSFVLAQRFTDGHGGFLSFAADGGMELGWDSAGSATVATFFILGSGSPGTGGGGFSSASGEPFALGSTSGNDTPLEIDGSTSGQAQIGAASVAGTPNRMNLPTTTGSSGQVLSTNGASPQQLSWITTTTGINGTSPSLPFGTDTGVVNAYVVNTTPAVALTQGNCFNWTASITSTGASTMNASGTGVKNLFYRFSAIGAGDVTTGVVYLTCYDGTEWLLADKASVPGSTINFTGSVYLSAKTNVSGTAAAPVLTCKTWNPTPVTTSCFDFQDASGHEWWFDIDNDASAVWRGGLITYQVPQVWDNPVSDTNGTLTGDDYFVQPGVTKTSGNSIHVKQSSGSGGADLLALDSITGINTAAGRPTVFVTTDFTDSTSGTLVPIPGLTWTFPTLKAYNGSFHCSLTFQQLTAGVSDSFGIAATVTAPTQINANGVSFSGVAGAPTTGTLTGLTTTTPTAIVTFTPVATTLWPVELNGTIEVPSSATPSVVNIYVSTTTGTDNIVIKRGSYCSLF